MFSVSAVSILKFIPKGVMFVFSKPSLKQIRWLPILFFIAVLTIGLRLHDKQNLFFQEQTGEDFFSDISLLGGSSLNAAPDQKSPVTSQDKASPQPISSTPVIKSAALPTTPQGHTQNASHLFSQTPQKNDAGKSALDVLNLTTEEVKILQSLSTRRGEIERREQALNEREKILTVVEKRLDQKIEELERIQASLKEVVDVKEKQEKEQLEGLVKIYELMKPEKAAEILSGLGADALLDLLEGMKKSKLSPILANMAPSIAQQITMELVARRKLTQQIQKIAQQKIPEMNRNNTKEN